MFVLFGEIYPIESFYIILGFILIAGIGLGSFLCVLIKFADAGLARLIGYGNLHDDFKEGKNHIVGNINRMCITRDVTDLNKAYDIACLHLNGIYSLNKHRLLQSSGREGL